MRAVIRFSRLCELSRMSNWSGRVQRPAEVIKDRPVRAIDGRLLPAAPGPVTSRLRGLYAALKDAEAARAGPL